MAIAPSRPAVSRLFLRTLMGTTVLIGVAAAQQAAAQTRAVSVCTGVQLQPSVVTDIVAPVLIGVTTPIENTVNRLLDIPLLNLLGVDLNTNVTGLLQTARAGQPITLQALDTNGNVIGPGDACRATSDSISLNTPAGISIGGNRISGLGAEGAVASAADINAIAFGNGAVAGAGATGSIAFGFNSNASVANSVALGAASTATRGAVANYTALGLAAPQTSVGEVSVGSAAGARQITNVAAGTAATDAATVGQLTGVANQVTALAGTAVQYDDATRARATLGGTGGTVLGNVAAGTVAATSTEAVNGAQLFATNAQVGANTSAITTLQGQTANAVRYDTDAAGVRTGGVTLAGVTPGATVTVGNVGAGTLDATSTQAVNGSQLFATNTQVGTNTTAIAGLDTRVTGNTNAIGGLDTRTTNNTTAIGGLDTRVTNNTTAIGGLDTRVTTNTTDIAALQGAAANAVRYDVDAAGNRTGGVTFAGTTPGATVTLGNVGTGALTATSTDAVNGSQLFATNTQVGTNTTAIGGLDTRVSANTTDIAALQGSAVRYDVDAAGVRTGGLTLAGATPGATVTLGNVGAGALTATSTDAVNGSQLFATNTQVGTNTAAIGGLDTRVTGNTNAIGGLDTRTTNNTTAIAGLDTRVTTNTTDIAALQGATANAVRYDVDAAGNRTGGVTFLGTTPGATVTLGNVGAGALTATSTDAVNGSQLFATNTQVGTNTAAIGGLDTRVTGNTNAIGGLDTRTTNNTTAIAGLDTRVTTNTTDIAALQGATANAVRYDVDAAGNRTGGLTLVGATPGATVTLGNIGAGALTATSTDAVNGSQLFATNTQVGLNTSAIVALQGTSANAVRYDTDAAGNRTGGVTFIGTTPGATVTLGNVGAGALTATSTDAVNGSQLFATNTQVGTNTAAIGGLDTRVTNNTTAIGGLDTRVTNNTTAIVALQGTAANAVRYDVDAAGNRTGGVTFIGTTPGATVTLGNVGAGALTAASTDAVNGSQLFATNTQVGSNTTAIAGLDTRVTTNTQNIANLQTTTANAVRYDVDAAGNRTGGLTLVGATPGATVTLGNIGAGALTATSTDAVNGSQLFATNQRLDGAITSIGGLDTRVTATATALAALTASAVQYDNVARDRLTFGGAAGTVLANVAAGQLSATSNEAVNGSQLFATNAQVAANTTAIAQIGNGSAGPVRYSTAGAPTTPNGGTVTDDLTLVGASGGAVALHNVRGGTVGAGSTDAVNGDQLNTTNQAVAALDTRVTATEGRLTTVETNVAGLDTRVSNNTTQIANNTTAISNLQNNVAGTSTAVTNLTTRVDNNTTAITNLQTQVGNAPIKYADAGSPTTPNGGAPTDDTTLVGASGGPVGLHNVRAGVVATGSTDAINGGQLAATNAQVASNTTAITNLSNTISGSTVAAIQYSNPGSPTTPNGGVRTNDVTLVGANAAAPVGLHNVASGNVAAGSTDAVNGGQLFAVSQQASNSLQYDRNAAGQRTNTITLAGGNAAAPVTIANVANGTVAAGSTQAVNGGQLHATNQTAQAALALGTNSVQYAADGGVSLGNGTTPVAVRNVAAGTAATDAVNVGQLQASMRNTFVEATNYIDGRLTQVGFDLRDMRRDMSAGSSAAMAVAALPQAMEPGATMVAIGAGTYRGQSAMAFGASRAFNDGQAVVKFGGTIDSRGYAGANAGVGFQF